MNNSDRARRDFLRTWLQELQGPIWGMLNSREVFRSWNKLVGAAEWPEHTNGYFIQWVNRNYLRSLMVTIRAMNDQRRDTRLLRRLLQRHKKTSPAEHGYRPHRRLHRSANQRIRSGSQACQRANRALQPIEGRRSRSDIRAHPRSRRHYLPHLPGPAHDHRRRNRYPPERRRLIPYYPWEVLFTEAWVTHDKHAKSRGDASTSGKRLTPSVLMSPRLIAPSGPLGHREPRRLHMRMDMRNSRTATGTLSGFPRVDYRNGTRAS